MSATTPTLSEYIALAPDGRTVSITKELFNALERFLKTDKTPGHIQVHFVRGGITAVKATVEVIYK
jgi:hypothetical protein